jgi:hypothetical protein
MREWQVLNTTRGKYYLTCIYWNLEENTRKGKNILSSRE